MMKANILLWISLNKREPSGVVLMRVFVAFDYDERTAFLYQLTGV